MPQDESFKDRIRLSMQKLHERQLREQEKLTKPRKKNAKPEKEVEKEVMAWLSNRGLFAHIVESKAVFSAKAGRYLHSQSQVGCADILAISPEGLACAIELKAPGRRSTLRMQQREFLLQYIKRKGLGAVITSASELELIYTQFLSLPENERPQYLMSLLPKQKENEEAPLFTEDAESPSTAG